MAEEKFERKLEVPEELIDECADIKNKLIRYSKEIETEEQHEEELVELITSIMSFNKAYKRKKNRKKPAKTETNKSSVQDSMSEEEDDKVDVPFHRQCSQPTVPKPAEISQVVEPQVQRPIVSAFVKKPSLRGYLLTPSMEMELEDRFRP